MLRTILILMLAAGAWMPAAAQTRIQLAPESSLTIVGRSSINRFSCEADDLRGSGMVEAGEIAAVLAVPVQQFDCGKKRMNRDLQDAMLAEHHPEIRFELVRTETNGSSDIEATGHLTIAGVTRTVVVHPEAEETNPGMFRIRGEKDLQMSDFGIEPPTALGGLIRVRDEITVRFDVLANTVNPESGPGQAFSLNQTQ